MENKEEYLALAYKTPEYLFNTNKDKSVLIIGTGSSTAELIKYKDQIKSKFDVIIGLNFATKNFEDVLDYHVILESNPVAIYSEMNKSGAKYRRDLPRILNWKCIHRFPKDLTTIYKAIRSNFDFNVDITKYKHNGSEGLLYGPIDTTGLSAGTVMSNAIHFACIMGCNKIYMVGADLLFRDENDHYYADNQFYRKSKTKIHKRSPIVKVIHKGKSYLTTELFRESAKFIDKIIKEQCEPNGIEMYDFSDGLLYQPKQLNMKDFFWRRIMRYVFDIDGVICTKELVGEYQKATPFYSMIDIINNLYKNGHDIVLCTARGMKNYDIYDAYSKWYDITKKQMDNWGVKYTRIIMGKPPGDCYIDDKAFRVNADGSSSNDFEKYITTVFKIGDIK